MLFLHTQHVHSLLVLLECALEFRRVALALNCDPLETSLENAVVSVPKSTLQLARVLKCAGVAGPKPHGNITAETLTVPWPQPTSLMHASIRCVRVRQPPDRLETQVAVVVDRDGAA